MVLHLAQVGTSVDLKASQWMMKRFSESNTKGQRRLGGSRSFERRG